MLSENDLALVHALQEAPRASWAALSSSLETDSRTLAKRYSRLREAGLLRVMATAGPRLLDRTVFGHLRLRAAPGHALDVAAQIARWPQASTVRLTDGSFDVHAFLVGTDHSALVNAAHEWMATLTSLQRAEINTVLETGDAGRAARLDALSSQQVSTLRDNYGRKPHSTRNTQLHQDDFELLRLLLRDGRTDIAELAAELERDPSVVSRRLARLQRDGFVDILALTPDQSSSAPVRALLWCAVAPQDLHAFVRKSANLPWVGLLTSTTGHTNVLVVANVRTLALLPEAQSELASMCPSLRIREIQLSTKAVKLHMRWLTDDERLTDDVADPFHQLQQDLSRV